MADAVLALPVKENYWLARLLWGDPNSPSKWFLTNANEDLVASPTGVAALFLGTPGMKINAQSNTGTFEQKTWSLDIPWNEQQGNFLRLVTSGRAKPSVWFDGWEYFVEDGESQVLHHISGKVSKVIKNPGGRDPLVRFEVLTEKNDIKRPLGFPALPTCQWEFGDMKTCGKEIESLKEGGSLDAIDGLIATISGLSAQPDRYWHRGYIEKDGIRILIKEWVQGDQFILNKLIPFYWEEDLPVDVTVAPGCDKSLIRCEFWGRLQDSFSGVGRSIPAYNPELGTS